MYISYSIDNAKFQDVSGWCEVSVSTQHVHRTYYDLKTIVQRLSTLRSVAIFTSKFGNEIDCGSCDGPGRLLPCGVAVEGQRCVCQGITPPGSYIGMRSRVYCTEKKELGLKHDEA